MLLMLLIGWTILLPAIVVSGLYVASNVLGRRRRAALMSTIGLDAAAAIHEPAQYVTAKPVLVSPVVVRTAEPGARPIESPRPSEPVAGPPVGATY
jgi:hypothetical protein